MAKKPVIILGAGLAGLACARTLQQAKRAFLLLESEPQVGGRVCSRRDPSGFLIDQGFQVLLNSYPELRRFVDLKELDLRAFHSGALIFNGHSVDLLANPLLHPETLLSGVFTRLMTLNDKALVVKLLAAAQSHRVDSPRGQMSTLSYLRSLGFSELFIESFWRPFLTGVFLDEELSLGSDYFKFLLRCFATGSVSLPARGMAELPKLIAQTLPADCVRLEQRVRSWTSQEVRLEGGEVLHAEHVVCAFDPENLQPHSNRFRSVVTHYFTSPRLEDLAWNRWLILIPRHLGLSIHHMALLTSVASEYGSNGRPLLSVSVVGEKPSTNHDVLMREIEMVAGRELGLEWVATSEVPRALPRYSGEESGAEGFAVRDEVFFCGDRWSSPSINGALRSGRLTAEAILRLN